MTPKITVPRLADLHVHLRQGAMLKHVLPHTAQQCGMATIMPNIEPGVFDGKTAKAYREEISAAQDGYPDFNPIMTLKLRDDTTPETILEAFEDYGVKAAKIYPAGVTTNSDDGVKDIENLEKVFDAMQKVGMILCIHGEMPGRFCLDRENAYLPLIIQIASKYPRLKVVAEHITCGDTVDVIHNANLDNLGATITLHHMVLTLDDVIGGKIEPHHFCKPVAKRPEDRKILLQAALGQYGDKFFLGSDSAPHAKHTKECAQGCAGVFTAPVLGQGLIQVFEKACADEFELKTCFENFACLNGPKFYGIPPSKETITYKRHEWRVPDMYGNVVPLWAGKRLNWEISQ